ncbi:hypothetical protein [Sphingobacterium daejeonense]|nr:hypothetical protein [Sphingobacterium daejeonense]VTQ01921.1 Uncharacterised protein [Sphingobacterium daejeonense]
MKRKISTLLSLFAVVLGLSAFHVGGQEGETSKPKSTPEKYHQ